MTKLSSKQGYSRRKARLKMKNKFPSLVEKGTHVHHGDHNPLNNNFDNLKILPCGKHIRIHMNIYWDQQQLKTLESLLVILNTFGY